MALIDRMLKDEWSKEGTLSYQMAYLLSRVLDTPVTIGLIALTFGSKVDGAGGWVLTLLLGNFGLPLLFLFNSYRTKRITDLDITKREERFVWFSFAGLCWLGTLVFTLNAGRVGIFIPELILMFQIWLAVFGLLNATITFLWKISGHAMVMTSLTLWLAVLWNPWFILGLITAVPVLAWARFRLQKHTPAQLAAGTLLMLIVTSTIWYLFNSSMILY